MSPEKFTEYGELKRQFQEYMMGRALELTEAQTGKLLVLDAQITIEGEERLKDEYVH